MNALPLQTIARFAKSLLWSALAIFTINLIEDFCFVVFRWDRSEFLPDFILLTLAYPAAYFIAWCIVRLLYCLYSNPLKAGIVGFIMLLFCTQLRVLLLLILLLGLLPLGILENRPYFNYTTPYFEFLVSKMSGSAFVCVWHAENVDNVGSLGVCERRYGSLGFDFGYVDVIFYDSDDQILLPKNQRSMEWQKIADELGISLDPAGVISPPIPLGGHFYHMAFENTGG